MNVENKPEKPDHILIVEDEKRIADILTAYLKQSGFETSYRETGAGVVDMVKNNPPDLMILDLMLPVMGGLDICREVRKFSPLPIIMVTAASEEIDRLLGLEMGADDYICKPFSPREVVARVKAVLRRAQLNLAGEKEPRIFDVDEEKLRISIKGQRLDLTPTEFRILSLLLKSPGRVYSRSQLLELCYAQEQNVFDRTIDSHVKNLRKKIARHLPEKDLIQSVYGVGYRLET